MSRYLVSVCLSVGLHATLILAFVYKANEKVELPSFMPVKVVEVQNQESQQEQEIVESVAIDEQALQKEIKRIEDEKQRKINVEKARQKRLRELEEKAKREKAAALAAKKKREQEERERKRLEKERKEKEKLLAEEKKALEKAKKEREKQEAELKKAEEKRKVEEKKRKEEAERKRKEQESKRKAEEQRKRKEEEQRLIDEAMMEQMMLEEIAEETSMVNSHISQRIRDEISLHKAKIMAKVIGKWRKPRFEQGVCKFKVRLAPGGTVVNVTEMNSPECTENIRRTGRAAIYAAEPLPVSSEQAVFNEMREIIIKFNPQESN